VKSLSVGRSNVTLLKDLSFDLEIGQIALITGANGSGKTTLIRHLMGFSKPLKGSISWFADSIGYLGHNNSLNNELSVAENINFYLGLYNKTGHFLASSDAMNNFGNDFLNLKNLIYKKVKHLSVGQQRKLAIYCSVLNVNLSLGSRFVWVIDEPMANLDKQSIKILLDFILYISQMNHFPFLNTSVILSAHDHSLFENELSLLIRI
jgi:ABC-type transport system involved in cytochrome c biogenesis ATPase subunit